MDIQTSKFFETIFPDLNNQFIEVRQISDQGATNPSFCRSIPDLVKELPGTLEEQERRNIYFGVCPRGRESGTKDAVSRVSVLWVDIDGLKTQELKSKAMERLKQLGYMSPSVILDSGHGFHCYWLLKESIEITGPEDIRRTESLLKGLTKFVDGDPSCAELARIMRVPGTWNVKDAAKPVKCEILEFNSDHLLNLSDFDEILPSDSEERKETGGTEGTEKNEKGWVGQALKDLKNGNRNTTFHRVSGRFFHDGLTADDVIAILTPQAERVAYPVDKLKKEVREWEKRYSSSIPFPVPPPLGGGTGNGIGNTGADKFVRISKRLRRGGRLANSGLFARRGGRNPSRAGRNR